MKPDTMPSPNAAAPMGTTLRWIPDAEVSVCQGCQLLFDWVRRKHHCRHCGRVFCDACTTQRSLLREDQILQDPARQYFAANMHNPQRVCEDCHHMLLPQQALLRETHANAVLTNSISESGPNRFLNSPYSFTLREEIRKAAYSVSNFTFNGVIKDQSIPLPLLSQAKGIAFLTVIKVGFVFTGRIGTGLVIARLSDGRWSAPSAIGTAGVGWGAQIGGELTDFVIILNTQSSVDAFCSNSQVNLGAEVGISAGPVGRVASGAMEASSDLDIAPCYSYSHSKGLFAGLSLEGSVILTRPDVNQAFYGFDVPPKALLQGLQPPPTAAKPLYDALDTAMNSPANGYNRAPRQYAASSDPEPMPYVRPSTVAPSPARMPSTQPMMVEPAPSPPFGSNPSVTI